LLGGNYRPQEHELLLELQNPCILGLDLVGHLLELLGVWDGGTEGQLTPEWVPHEAGFILNNWFQTFSAKFIEFLRLL
jgi:hypothetical protein